MTITPKRRAKFRWISPSPTKFPLYDMQTLHGRLKQVTGALPDYLDYETPGTAKSPAVKACLKGVMAAPGFAPSVASAESAPSTVRRDEDH